MRPSGTEAFIGDRPVAKTATPSNSNGFIPGFTTKGPVDEALAVISRSDLEDKFGIRLEGHPEVFDAVDAALAISGGGTVYVGRVTGDGATKATKTLLDAAGKTCLKFTAKEIGEYGNKIEIVNTTTAGEFAVVVKFEGKTVEGSPAFANLAAAVAWATNVSDFVDATSAGLESALVPKTQTVTLGGGDSKIGEADVGDLETTLALFEKDLGQGQLIAPQFTDEPSHLALIAHAKATNRRHLLTFPVLSAEELIAKSTALRGAPEQGPRYAAGEGAPVVIPGLVPNTTRTVALAAVHMGLIMRSEAEGNLPARPAAGKKRGSTAYVLELTDKYSDEERAELEEAGINVAIMRRGVMTLMGDVTLADPTTDPDWTSLAASRMAMAVVAGCDEVLEDFEYEDIDAKGAVFKDLQGRISGDVMMPFYSATPPAFYGELPEEAFAIDTGPNVNTPTSIAAKEIKAQVAFRESPTGRWLSVEVVKVPITEAVA